MEADARGIPTRTMPAGPPAPERRADPSPSGIHRWEGSPLLVNLTIDRAFDFRQIYRLASLAVRNGGLLEHCNGEIAMFAFPEGGVTAFMEDIGYRMPVTRTRVSSREGRGSVVNIRFRPDAGGPTAD